MALRFSLAPALSLLALFSAVLLVAALPAQPAAAQQALDEERDYGPEEGDWEVTLTGSGSNDNNFDAGGFGASGSLGYFFTENAEAYVRHTTNFSDSEAGDDTILSSTRVGLDYHFPLGRFYPFVGVNLGGVYGNEVEETFTGAPEVGVKFFALEKTFLFALAEYQFFFDTASSADEAFDDGLFVYSVGVGFNW